MSDGARLLGTLMICLLAAFAGWIAQESLLPMALAVIALLAVWERE